MPRVSVLCRLVQIHAFHPMRAPRCSRYDETVHHFCGTLSSAEYWVNDNVSFLMGDLSMATRSQILANRPLDLILLDYTRG